MGDLGVPKAERITIDGRWAIVGPPVAGGMASVVEAFDLDGEFGKVALKLLPVANDDRWRRAGFEREQQALARLVHPNIVRLLSTGRDQSTNQRYLGVPPVPNAAAGPSQDRWRVVVERLVGMALGATDPYGARADSSPGGDPSRSEASQHHAR